MFYGILNIILGIILLIALTYGTIWFWSDVNWYGGTDWCGIFLSAWLFILPLLIIWSGIDEIIYDLNKQRG